LFHRRRGISIKRRLDQIFSEIQLFLWEIGTGCSSSEVFERIKEKKKTHRKNLRQKLEKIDNTQEEICKIYEDKFEEQGLLTNT